MDNDQPKVVTNHVSKTADDLLKEIQSEDPAFMPQNNIVSLRPLPDISNILPITFESMEKETPPPLQFVMTPFLPVQGIAYVYAKTGLGKTLFTLNLAYAIASGGNFLKYTCPSPKRVLYVDGEMPYTQLHNRIMQIANQQGEMDYKDNLLFLTPDKLLPFQVPMIDNPVGQEIYNQLLKKYNIDVLILDNFSMLSSFDENKSNEFKPVQDWLLYLRSIGKTIINVHHCGKGDDYRGSSRMLDCADTAIHLQAVNQGGLDEDHIKGNKFKITYTKSRSFGGKDALPFEVSFEAGQWAYRSTEQTDMDRVVEMNSLKMNQISISKELGCSQSKVAKLIGKARKLGLIRD